MEVANVQVVQNTSKPQSSVKVKSELFTQLLSDAIDTEVPGLTCDEKGEEIPDEIMEMMLGMLNLNLPLHNSLSEINHDEITLVDQAGVDTETLNSSIIMSGMQDTENVDAFTESNSIIGNEFTLLEEAAKNDSTISENINIDEITKKSLGNTEDQTEDTLLNTAKLEHSIYKQVQNSAELDGNNDTYKLDSKEASIKLDIASELKTDEKNDLEKEIDLNLMDNVQMRSFNNIANDTAEIKEIALSDDNIQRVNDSIIQLVETTKEGEANILKVKLYPEDLGTVDVTLKMEEGKLTAKILVDNEQVKSMFTKSINELNESLLKQNIQVKKINVDLNLDTSSNNMNNQAFDFNQQRSFNQGTHQMRNYNLRSYYSDVENVISSEPDIHKTGELSILA